MRSSTSWSRFHHTFKSKEPRGTQAKGASLLADTGKDFKGPFVDILHKGMSIQPFLDGGLHMCNARGRCKIIKFPSSNTAFSTVPFSRRNFGARPRENSRQAAEDSHCGRRMPALSAEFSTIMKREKEEEKWDSVIGGQGKPMLRCTGRWKLVLSPLTPSSNHKARVHPRTPHPGKG